MGAGEGPASGVCNAKPNTSMSKMYAFLQAGQGEDIEGAQPKTEPAKAVILHTMFSDHL